MNKILAYRDGQEREFTERVWEAMGIGHCGWVQAPEIPREVVKSLEVAPTTPKEVLETLEKQRKTRKKND